MSNLKAALDMLRQTFRHFPMRLLCAALCIGAATPVAARIVDKVVVRGAQFIPEDDIRMTCGAEAGIEYVDAELQAIEDCLMSTGVFESVALSREDGTLFIDVQELNTRPGRIDATLAYVSQDGITGSLSFERYNLFDRTYGSASLEFGKQIRRIDTTLYRTEAFDTPLDLGFELSGGHFDYDDRSYSENQARIESYLAWKPSDSIRLEGGIGYRFHSLDDLDSDASALLEQEETDGISAPYLRLGLEHSNGSDDARKFGYSINLDQYFWNIGSDDPISDTRLGARVRIPVAREFHLVLGVNAGQVHGMNGNATRAIDRFFPGADTFRGFAPRGIGPRDGDDALGGNTYTKASIELQRDFGEVYHTPLRAGIFVDTGAVWDLDDTLGGAIDDGRHRRSSVGLSLTFDVSNTPVALYIAQPFEREPGDEEQAFGLSLSTRF